MVLCDRCKKENEIGRETDFGTQDQVYHAMMAVGWKVICRSCVALVEGILRGDRGQNKLVLTHTRKSYYVKKGAAGMKRGRKPKVKVEQVEQSTQVIQPAQPIEIVTFEVPQ